ncbi:unnamed protein product, partial [Discosporangium mesarthrocarpum]
VYAEPYSLDRRHRYEVLEAVGRGAFGEVLLARDRQALPHSRTALPPSVQGNEGNASRDSHNSMAMGMGMSASTGTDNWKEESGEGEGGARGEIRG